MDKKENVERNKNVERKEEMKQTMKEIEKERMWCAKNLMWRKKFSSNSWDERSTLKESSIKNETFPHFIIDSMKIHLERNELMYRILFRFARYGSNWAFVQQSDWHCNLAIDYMSLQKKNACYWHLEVFWFASAHFERIRKL